ncbi:hypothetical protein ZWY2020_030687 [Hordeum vulgare]|nr:hypothetical protein ZWY2020_030687 [Hordeum vulgare]
MNATDVLLPSFRPHFPSAPPAEIRQFPSEATPARRSTRRRRVIRWDSGGSSVGAGRPGSCLSAVPGRFAPPRGSGGGAEIDRRLYRLCAWEVVTGVSGEAAGWGD